MTSTQRVAARYLQADLPTMPRPKLVKLVNDIMAPHTKGIFRDAYWSPIQAIWKAFEHAGLTFSIDKSEYQHEPGASVPSRKVWNFSIDFITPAGRTDTIYGVITASGNGPVSDPLESYDVVAYAN